jgi:hypothetical protein
MVDDETQWCLTSIFSQHEDLFPIYSHLLLIQSLLAGLKWIQQHIENAAPQILL